MPRLLRLRRSRPALTALLLGLGACSGAPAPDRAGASGWQVEVLENPLPGTAGMPHLSPWEDGAVISWWTPVAGVGAEGGPGPGHGADPGAWALQAASWDPAAGFGPVREVTRGRSFFVNWADFPSVVPVSPDHWVAHWLQRTGDATYAYGIRVSESRDRGRSWSRPWTPHEDDSPTEHGFAAILPGSGPGAASWEMVWLDGRRYAAGPHGPATGEMTVRWRSVDAAGEPGPERLVDARACDCCQTDLARTGRGPVAVYRDRSPDEVRDIALVRREGGAWTEPAPVHRDGWVISGCPVNGPAVDARGDEVVVAWFTGAGDTPRVRVAFSSDAGDTFAPPVAVDDGRPVGRVDVAWTARGAAVLWLEEAGSGEADLRLRLIPRQGAPGPAQTVARTAAARASGFPQLVPVGTDALLAAWTHPGGDAGPDRIEMALLHPETDS